jgi:hypothetical protein
MTEAAHGISSIANLRRRRGKEGVTATSSKRMGLDLLPCSDHPPEMAFHSEEQSQVTNVVRLR